MRCAAAELRARHPRARAERRHGFEQAMGQGEHRHDDVFGDRRLMTEHVANGDPFRHRFGVEEVEPGRYRLQQAKARRGREPRPPDMTDHDLRIGQQRGKLRRIALIIEDRGFERRLHLGENPRRDRGGEMAEKQGFHVLPSPTQYGIAIVALPSPVAKGLEASPVVVGRSARDASIYKVAAHKVAAGQRTGCRTAGTVPTDWRDWLPRTTSGYKGINHLPLTPALAKVGVGYGLMLPLLPRRLQHLWQYIFNRLRRNLQSLKTGSVWLWDVVLPHPPSAMS